MMEEELEKLRQDWWRQRYEIIQLKAALKRATESVPDEEQEETLRRLDGLADDLVRMCDRATALHNENARLRAELVSMNDRHAEEIEAQRKGHQELVTMCADALRERDLLRRDLEESDNTIVALRMQRNEAEDLCIKHNHEPGGGL